MEDYLTEIKYAGLTSRIKRLSDQVLLSGRNFYQHLNVEIEPNWFLVFRILKEDKVSTVTAIAKKLKFSHPSVITIVKKMKAKGFVEISTHSKDSRIQEIRLTKKALKDFKKNEKIWKACEHAVESIFPNETFLNELEKIEAAFNKSSFMDRALKQLKTEKIKYVDFQPKHSKAFKSLNVEWIEKHFTVEPIDLKILDEPIEYIIKKGGHIIMATYEGKAIGTVALLQYPNKPIELGKMAVDPNFRGLGVGNKLMEKAIDYCKEKNYDSVVLYTHKVLKPALSLYKKYSFKRVKLEDNSGYERADVKMELKLKN